jgi:para-nitrobenzyl esterase
MVLLPAIGTRTVFAAEGPVAETTAGKIQGVTTGGVHAFKGVSYGAPTSGRNRFMPPQKPQPWAGVRSAAEWAGRAPQALPSGARRPELSGLSGPPDRLAESEECLTLNVWTRGMNDGRKRPVMVWYHGGGFSNGSSNMPRLDGTTLATLYDGGGGRVGRGR